MFEKKTLKGTDEVLSVQRGAMENFVVCDLPGFADYADQLPIEKRAVGEEGTKWWGGMTYDQSVAAVRCGDTAGVAASDKLLSEIETLLPVSQSWRSFNSVVGMCPNVPQYLAGNPYNMRLKRRCATATAPLSIFVELVLWCVIAIGQTNSRSSLCVRLDTGPLDLARSAHVFTHPSVFRALGYKSLENEFYSRGWNGDWAFGDHGLHVGTAAQSYQRLLRPGSDVLFIPPVHISDLYLAQPAKWLRAMITLHGGVQLEAA